MKKAPLALIFLLNAMALITGCENTKSESDSQRKWWKEAVVYQLYPRSFKDSNGDGVGDLQGIISKLDYLESLGVDAVWLNPIYTSPNDDNGYDISDYRNIMAEFGTMEDFDSLLQGLHKRGIKLVMDVVVNHSSDEHPWFQESRKSRTSPYRDYYHWWNAEKGKPAPRYSLFDINHDAWKYDSLTDAYYLHYFSRKQPDLNWENPKLRQEVYDIMKFWANKGVDGFRLDAFQFASKDTTFPVLPDDLNKNFMKYYAMGPHLHDYLKEMNLDVFSKYDIMSVAEGAGNNFEDAHNLVDEDRQELNMAYAFEGVDIAKSSGYSILHFKEVFSRWDSAFAEKGWLSIFLANHDQARMVSRFGNDSPAYRELSSKMLSTFIMTMRGTPYFYYGDELGMSNPGFETIDEYRDMPMLNEYQYQLKNGGDLNAYMKRMQFESRDNGRTPFQWDSTYQSGFTTGTPWIKVNPNYKHVNSAAQENDPSSCLNYFRKLIKLRKENLALVYGKYQLLDKKNPAVYAYTRTYEGKQFLIVLNFTASPASTPVNWKAQEAKLILSNYPDAPHVKENSLHLQPYQSAIYDISAE